MEAKQSYFNNCRFSNLLRNRHSLRGEGFFDTLVIHLFGRLTQRERHNGHSKGENQSGSQVDHH